jgi:hypothetical protein
MYLGNLKILPQFKRSPNNENSPKSGRPALAENPECFYKKQERIHFSSCTTNLRVSVTRCVCVKMAQNVAQRVFNRK